MEFRLLATCCHWPANHAAVHELLTHTGIRWNRLLHLTQRHRVAGLVHHALAPHPAVPPATLAALSKSAAAIARANLLAVSLSAQIRAAFQNKEVDFLVLKGAPVGQLAYGDFSLRHSKDVDLLIDPAKIEPATGALARLGFHRTDLGHTLTAPQNVMWRRFRKHNEYVHQQTGVHLELHWRAFDNAHLGALNVHQPEWVEMGHGIQLPTPQRQDLLLNLCLHGAGHAWFRMKWIADVAALLQQQSAASIHALLETARRRDLDRPVEQAILLCAELFPNTSAPLLPNASSAGRWLARKAATALRQEHATSPSPESDFVPEGLAQSRLILRRSWRYRAEEVRVMMASPADWKSTPIPARMHFLYPVLRLPLWFRRRWFSKAAKIDLNIDSKADPRADQGTAA